MTNHANDSSQRKTDDKRWSAEVGHWLMIFSACAVIGGVTVMYKGQDNAPKGPVVAASGGSGDIR
jgi:hypothetical protein